MEQSFGTFNYLLGRGNIPFITQVNTGGFVIVRIMTRLSKGDCGNQSATGRRVECVPLQGRRPTMNLGEAEALTGCQCCPAKGSRNHCFVYRRSHCFQGFQDVSPACGLTKLRNAIEFSRTE